MSDTTYNGWSNYETWLANLWLTNESADYDYLIETCTRALDDAIERDAADVRDAAAADAAYELQSMLEGCTPELSGLMADLLRAAMQAINWHEIAAHHVADIPLYSACWNMPGYLPDCDPALFIDPDCALDFICESADHAGIDASEWRADENGEFGLTVGGYHYFVKKV